jgi:hypothetical protein
VAHERARVHVPKNGNVIALEIGLRGFFGTPIGSDARKFPDKQRLDVGSRGFFVIGIRANVSNVRVGETNDLSGVTRVGENFLITGEAGIENDFATAASFRSRRAAGENASIFKRKVGDYTNLRGQRVFLR